MVLTRRRTRSEATVDEDTTGDEGAAPMTRRAAAAKTPKAAKAKALAKTPVPRTPRAKKETSSPATAPLARSTRRTRSNSSASESAASPKRPAPAKRAQTPVPPRRRTRSSSKTEEDEEEEDASVDGAPAGPDDGPANGALASVVEASEEEDDFSSGGEGPSRKGLRKGAAPTVRPASSPRRNVRSGTVSKVESDPNVDVDTDDESLAPNAARGRTLAQAIEQAANEESTDDDSAPKVDQESDGAPEKLPEELESAPKPSEGAADGSEAESSEPVAKRSPKKQAKPPSESESESESESASSGDEMSEEGEAEQEDPLAAMIASISATQAASSGRKKAPAAQESADEEEEADVDADADADAEMDGGAAGNSDDESDEEPADDEEQALERALFGDLTSAKTLRDGFAAVSSKKRQRPEGPNGGSLFFEDKGDSGSDSDGESDGEAAGVGEGRASKAQDGAAWVDDDDDAVQVDLSKVHRLRKLRKTDGEAKVSGREFVQRLREQRSKMVDRVGWASAALQQAGRDEEENEDSEDEAEQAEVNALLRSSEGLTKSNSAYETIPPGKLSLSRLNDANQSGPSKAVVQTIDWHKNGLLMLTAGMDKTVRVFQVDGKRNSKIESVFLRDMPVFSAGFAGRAHEQIICSGRRPFFYWIDLESGAAGKIPGVQGRAEKSFESMSIAPDGSMLGFLGYDGNLLLVSQQTKQLVGSLKMNERGSCSTFSQDGLYAYSSGASGNVYCWDMRMRTLLHKFRDQGSINTRSIAVSSDNRRLAVGSTNGVVNLYDIRATQASTTPEPLKAIMNLTTAVDHVTFNHDGQLLAIMSRRKLDALRLFNVNTLSVVQNWPTAKTPIHYGSAVAFSPNSNMLVCGNDRGRCLLYRLHHYAGVSQR